MAMDLNINLSFSRDIETLQLLKTMVIQMNSAIEALAVKVERLITVDDSAIALIVGLKAQLDEAIATGDLAEVSALSERIGTSTEALAAAVVANTPVDPGPGDPSPA